MIEFVTILITATITFALTLFFRNFLGKYAETKGANRATKEDIGKITTIVESIKSELLKDTEQLKAQLSFFNQHQLNLKEAERDAIFDFNKKINAYIYYLVRLSLSGYDFDNYQLLKAEYLEINKRKYECDIAEAHLTLLIQDKSFGKKISDLNITALKYEKSLGLTMQSIISTFTMADLMAKTEPQNLMPIQLKAIQDVHNIFMNYSKASLEIYKNIIDESGTLRQLMYARLLEIQEPETE